MHDGVPCYKARVLSEDLKSAKVPILDLTGHSLHLSPIENC